MQRIARVLGLSLALILAAAFAGATRAGAQGLLDDTVVIVDDAVNDVPVLDDTAVEDVVDTTIGDVPVVDDTTANEVVDFIVEDTVVQDVVEAPIDDTTVLGDTTLVDGTSLDDVDVADVDQTDVLDTTTVQDVVNAGDVLSGTDADVPVDDLDVVDLDGGLNDVVQVDDTVDGGVVNAEDGLVENVDVIDLGAADALNDLDALNGGLVELGDALNGTDADVLTNPADGGVNVGDVTVIDGDVLPGTQVDADDGLLNGLSVLDGAVDGGVLTGETLDNLTVIGDRVDVLDGSLADEPLATDVISDVIDGGVLNGIGVDGILPNATLGDGLLNDVVDVNLLGDGGVLDDGAEDGLLDVDLIGDVADGGVLNDGLLDGVVGLDLFGDGADDGSAGDGGLIGGIADGAILPGDGPLAGAVIDLGDIAIDDLLGIGRDSSPALPVPAPTTPAAPSTPPTSNNNTRTTTTIIRRVDHRVTYIRNFSVVHSQNSQRGMTTIDRTSRGIAGFTMRRPATSPVVATALPSAGSGHAAQSPVRAETLALASLLLAVAGAGARRVSGGRRLS
ncbi:MAG TPA: hypothetical protein VM450_05420 [Thermomicrobiales bacterium]|nr:hypothetical protein [Thermomicrobiales bacterium]